MASGNPLSPSTQPIRMSRTMRLEGSKFWLRVLTELQQFLGPFEVNTQCQVHGLALCLTARPRLQVDRVEVDDGVHRLQRPVLPKPHLVEYRVGDVRDERRRNLNSVKLPGGDLGSPGLSFHARTGR
jgi:hypothetical protein